MEEYRDSPIQEPSILPFIPTSFLSGQIDMFDGDMGYEDNECQSFDGEGVFQTNSTALLPAKKRRQRPSRGKAFPRIIKYDIRRYYGQMFVNAMNSHNGLLLDAFLDRYTLPHLTMTKLVGVQCTALNRSHSFVEQGYDGLSQITVKGRANVSRYWQALQSLVPDQVLRLNSVRIARNVRSVMDSNTGSIHLVGNDTTRVICEWEGRATQVYEGPPPCLFAYAMLQQGNVDEMTANNVESSSSASSLSSSPSSSSIAKKPRSEDSYDYFCYPRGIMFPLKQWPMAFAFNLRGHLVMEIDKELRLQTLDFGPVEFHICV